MERTGEHNPYGWTTVQFVHFQAEFTRNPESPGSGMQPIAAYRPWVAPAMFRTFNRPLSVADFHPIHDVRRQSGWVGAAHYVVDEVMPPMEFRNPETLQPTGYRARHLIHRFAFLERDKLGTKFEIVLEEMDADGEFKEVAAMMADREDDQEQMMTICSTPATDDPPGDWHEPASPDEVRLARRYIFYLGMLANQRPEQPDRPDG